MTIRFIAKCDLCGQEHELGFSRKLDTEPRQFEMPDGWIMLNYASSFNSPTSTAVPIMICPDCDKALRYGVDIISAHQQAEVRKDMEAMSDARPVPFIPTEGSK